MIMMLLVFFYDYFILKDDNPFTSSGEVGPPEVTTETDTIEIGDRLTMEVPLQIKLDNDSALQISIQSLNDTIVNCKNIKTKDGTISLNVTLSVEEFRCPKYSKRESWVFKGIESGYQLMKKTDDKKKDLFIGINCNVRKDNFSINPAHIFYARADGNYTCIYLVDDVKKVIRIIKRISLSDFAKQLKQVRFILQVHKSYLVNLKEIDQVSGNSAGLKVNLKHCQNIDVPVSRNNIAKFEKCLALFSD